jgi:hypothetical protein
MNTPRPAPQQEWSTRGFTTADPERQGIVVGFARPVAEPMRGIRPSAPSRVAPAEARSTLRDPRALLRG